MAATAAYEVHSSVSLDSRIPARGVSNLVALTPFADCCCMSVLGLLSFCSFNSSSRRDCGYDGYGGWKRL
jgi:hypothetical protein